MLLRSTRRYFLGTYHVLSPGPFAVGEEAKKKMRNESQTVVSNLSLHELHGLSFWVLHPPKV